MAINVRFPVFAYELFNRKEYPMVMGIKRHKTWCVEDFKRSCLISAVSIMVAIILLFPVTTWSQEAEPEPAADTEETAVTDGSQPVDETVTDDTQPVDETSAEPELPMKNYQVTFKSATYKTRSGRQVTQPDVDFPKYFTDIFRKNLRPSDPSDRLDLSGLDNFTGNTLDVACGYKHEALIQSHLILDENDYCYKSQVALSDQDQVIMEVRMKFSGTKILFQFDHGKVPRASQVSQRELMDLVNDLVDKDQFAVVVDGPDKNCKVQLLKKSGDIGLGFYSCLENNMPIEVVSLTDYIKFPNPVYYQGGLLNIPAEAPAVYLVDNVYSFPEGETDWRVKTRLFYKNDQVRSCTDGKTFVVYPYYDRYRIEHETDLTYYTESPEPVVTIDDQLRTVTREYIYMYITDETMVTFNNDEYQYALPASLAFSYQGPNGERMVDAPDSSQVGIIRKYASCYKLGLNDDEPNSAYWEPFEIAFEGQESIPVDLVRKGQDFEHEFILSKPDTLEIEDFEIAVSVTDAAAVDCEIPEALTIGYSEELTDNGKLSLHWLYPVYSSDDVKEESRFSVEVPTGYIITATTGNDSLDQYLVPIEEDEDDGAYRFAMLIPLETVNLSISLAGD